MTANTNGTAFPTTSREAAFRYHKQGWAPLPLPPQTKRPALTGWPSFRFEPSVSDEYFPVGGEQNIGLLLGAASSGLVDVDLDCPEARAAAPFILPDTNMVGGRESAPDSHWWYTVDFPPDKSSEKFSDPTFLTEEKGLLLELRSTGGQTVVSPSVYPADPEEGHPEPERCVWSRNTGPAKIDIGELMSAVKTLATAGLIGRHWPKGARNAAALALSGGLLRAGWPVERAENFIRAVCAAAEDEETENRVETVAATAKKLAACQVNGWTVNTGAKKVTGWPTLASLIGQPGNVVVSKVLEWLNIRSETWPPTPGQEAPWTAPEPLPGRPPVPPFPIEVFPAALGDYWSAAARSLGVPVDYVAVPALALLGATCGRALAVSLKRTYQEPPLLWCVVVAAPGRAKSAALNFALGSLIAIAQKWVTEHKEAMKDYRVEKARWEEEMKDWKKGGCEGEPPEEPTQPILKQLVFANFTVESLLRGNVAYPRGVVIAKDELAGLVQALNQYKGGKGDDKQNLLSMWAGASLVVNREKDRQAGIPPLTLPHSFVAVAGMIQPDVLAAFRGDLGSKEFVQDGWADRFLMSYPDPLPLIGETWETISEELESGYAAIILKLLNREMVPIEADGEVVGHRPYYANLSEEACREWEAFTVEIADRANRLDPTDPYIGVLSKYRHHGLRLVALMHVLRLAAGEVAEDTPIDAETIRRAVVIVWYFERHGERCLGIGWADRPSRVASRLIAWLLRYPERHSFTRSDAYLALKDRRDVRTSEALNAAFSILVDHNFIRPLGFVRNGQSGPQADRYAVNPEWDRKQSADSEGNISEPPSEKQSSNIRDAGDGKQENPPQQEPSSPVSRSESAHNSCVTVPNIPNIEQPSEKQPSNIRDVRDGKQEHQPETRVVEHQEADTTCPLVVSSVGALGRVVAAIEDSGGPVGLDCETTGLDHARDRVRLLSLATPKGPFVVDVFALTDPTAALAPVFETLAQVEVIGHNLGFDLPFLLRLGFTPGRVRDTILASQVLHAGNRPIRHGLKDVAARALGMTVEKELQKANWSGPITPEMLQYAATDAELPVRIWAALALELDVAGLAGVVADESAALPCVAWAARSGVGFDRAAWEALTVEAEAHAAKLREQLDSQAPNAKNLFGATNWNSPQQVQTAFSAIGITLKSTDDDALAAVDHPLATLLRDYRSAAKLVGTYGREWLRHVGQEGRVYATWKQIGAGASGRMSCKEPNLQQLPRDPRYRRCFIAPPGRALVKADYSQIELRIAAKISGDRRMLDAYRNGEDLHTLTARALLGKTEVTKADRQLAKAVNFGLLYGQGAEGLRRYALGSYGVSLTLDEAKAHRETFFRTYTGLRAWHRKLGKAPIDTHTLTGRRRLAVAKFTEKLNTPVQGTGADGLKRALALLWERRQQCPGAFPVLLVHDEIVVECATGQEEVAAVWVRDSMRDGMAPLIDPIPVEIELSQGPTWGG